MLRSPAAPQHRGTAERLCAALFRDGAHLAAGSECQRDQIDEVVLVQLGRRQATAEVKIECPGEIAGQQPSRHRVAVEFCAGKPRQTGQFGTELDSRDFQRQDFRTDDEIKSARIAGIADYCVARVQHVLFTELGKMTTSVQQQHHEQGVVAVPHQARRASGLDRAYGIGHDLDRAQAPQLQLGMECELIRDAQFKPA